MGFSNRLRSRPVLTLVVVVVHDGGCGLQVINSERLFKLHVHTPRGSRELFREDFRI